MKAWREVAVPHRDVLEGTFQQSEFAADLTAVQTGKAPREYQDPVAFFERTFITEGMRLLLIQVAQRLAGKGGEPVIQLQTAFGGGKTHTLLAVYHMATRTCPLADLAGVPAVLKEVELKDVPQARVAILDGHAHAPGQSWKHEKQTVKTLWGELAWQMGGADAFALVKDADTTGTSPGKKVLADLLARHAPCVVLIDELVAYVRQFAEGQVLSGGSYDTNISFVNALTEAMKLVPNGVLLASLPESEVEAGSQHGVAALRGLEKIFGRTQALWKPVATEEAFEIVRRRLFEPIRDAKSRDAVCRAFADTYIEEGDKMPSETQEARYYDRLKQAYPIHPEVFDRLYEDWTTIDGFQRTRGVLKLMAKVIYRLWTDDNKDLMIMPGSLPLYEANTRSELLYYLPAGWDAVLDKDVDSERAETTELEKREPRFGQVNAARRVARTVFLGSAPSSISTKQVVRGLDRGHVLVGCLQPEQKSAVYGDALDRLVGRLHYMSCSGEKELDTTRFWFDTRANMRREMEDRKRRFDEATEVRSKIAAAVKRVVSAAFFDGVHIFTAHADVPDDAFLRLVVLPPERAHTRDDDHDSSLEVLTYVRNNGAKPRHRGNRLLFLAADRSVLVRLRDVARIALAWGSIVDDIREGRLNTDQLQKKQAEKDLQTAEEVLVRVVRESYKWLLCPTQENPTDQKVTVEAFPLNTTAESVGGELERVCMENELVITTWSPVHLRTTFKDLYWKGGRTAYGAMAFFEDTQKYIYLPRLRNRDCLSRVIRVGAASRDFFGIAYGQSGGQFDGFKLGTPDVQLDETLLLIEPEAARAYEATSQTPPTGATGTSTAGGKPGPVPGPSGARPGTQPPGGGTTPATPKYKSFHGTVEIPAATARVRMIEVAEEVISALCKDPNATVRVTVEIAAEFPEGAPPEMLRIVTENSKALKFASQEFE